MMVAYLVTQSFRELELIESFFFILSMNRKSTRNNLFELIGRCKFVSVFQISNTRPAMGEKKFAHGIEYRKMKENECLSVV